MYEASTPLSRGIGTTAFECLPKNLIASTRFSGDIDPSREIRNRSADDVWLSSPAAASFSIGPIDESFFATAGSSDLLEAARSAKRFLDDHPRLADSSFGKSVLLIVRAAVHLERNGGAAALPEESRSLVQCSLENVKAFLEEHPRVADSRFGVLVADMAKAVARGIGTDDGGAGTRLCDWLLEAAKRADLYLEEYPSLASMPLGEVVARLTDGVKALADGNPLDTDLQTLAKRVGYFLEHHPRLAQSEFGQLIAPLVRGLAGLDGAMFRLPETPAAETIATVSEVPVVLGVTTPGDVETLQAMKAAA